MKLIKLRLILDVNFDPQGVSKNELIENLQDIIKNAAINGMLTVDSPAMVEGYEYKVTERRAKKPISTKSKSVITSYPNGLCPDCHRKIPNAVHEFDACCTCGHVFYSTYENDDVAERNRRDEKNGLYPDKVDVAN